MENKNHLIIAFVSEEHLHREMFQFAILQRKIRKWVKNQRRSAMEIVNQIRRIQNTFDSAFIEKVVDGKFTLEERKIINTVLGRMPPHHEFTVKWDLEMRKLRC